MSDPFLQAQIKALISSWQQEAAELRQQAAKYSPRGARQAYLRGEAGALDRCAQALKLLVPAPALGEAQGGPQ